MIQVSEAERIVKLMLYIREAGPVSLTAIRDALPTEYGEETGSGDSARRRFERDKKTLQDNGVFLTVNQDQQYSLDTKKTVAAPLDLTSSQVSLLRLLCAALLDDKDYPFKDELRMVLVKLGDELELPDMLPHLEDESGNKNNPAFQGFTKIKKAISERKKLSFAYVDALGAQSMRHVEPMGAFFINHACYLVAFDTNASSERVFRLDRMNKIRVNSANPKSPDFEERSFNVADYFGLPFQFGTQDTVARIQFDEISMQRARQLSMGLGTFETQEDGSSVWTISCKDDTALAQWCIENGPGLNILEPQSARDAYIEGLGQFLGRMFGEVPYER